MSVLPEQPGEIRRRIEPDGCRGHNDRHAGCLQQKRSVTHTLLRLIVDDGFAGHVAKHSRQRASRQAEFISDAIEADGLIECRIEKRLDVFHEFPACVDGRQGHMFRGKSRLDACGGHHPRSQIPAIGSEFPVTASTRFGGEADCIEKR